MPMHRNAQACLALSLLGFSFCVSLWVLHLSLSFGQLYGGFLCGKPGSLFNCHAVAASPAGSFFGIPLPIWGMIGYLATLALAFIAWQFPEWTGKAFTLLVGLSSIFVAIDAGLLGVMIARIRHLCLLCLMTYLVNVLLLVIARSAVAQPWRQLFREVPSAIKAFLPRPHVPVVWIFWGVALMGTLGVLAVHATTLLLPGDPRAIWIEQVRQAAKVRVQVDTQADPRLGLPGAPIQMVEFTDFLCPSCAMASQWNRIVVDGRRPTVAWIVKHFPLDTSCNGAVRENLHPGACRLAAAAECAHEQGKFWPFHELLFQQAPFKVENLESAVSQLGLDPEAFSTCMASGRGLQAVQRDIEEATRLRVSATPTHLVNGVLFEGSFPPGAFEAILNELRRQEAR